MFSFLQYLKEDQEKKKKAKYDFMQAHTDALERTPSYNYGDKSFKLTKTTMKSPDELQEGEYSFYEPSNLRGTSYRGDIIVRWQGKLLS